MMKETTFYIVLNIRTANGFESFGEFILGNSRDAAYSIFQKLKGSKKINEKTILHLDFMETKKGLPLNIGVISCSLEELAENCKIITKETFKLLNLEKT
jgi:hypothetical protein